MGLNLIPSKVADSKNNLERCRWTEWRDRLLQKLESRSGGFTIIKPWWFGTWGRFTGKNLINSFSTSFDLKFWIRHERAVIFLIFFFLEGGAFWGLFFASISLLSLAIVNVSGSTIFCNLRDWVSYLHNLLISHYFLTESERRGRERFGFCDFLVERRRETEMGKRKWVKKCRRERRCEVYKEMHGPLQEGWGAVHLVWLRYFCHSLLLHRESLHIWFSQPWNRHQLLSWPDQCPERAEKGDQVSVIWRLSLTTLS